MSSILAPPAAPEFDEGFRIPASVRDLHSFLDWVHSDEFPDRGRISYINGDIFIDMSPQEIDTHAKVKGRVFSALDDIVEQEQLGNMLPDQTLFVNEEADVSNEPDMMFVSYESLRDGRVEYRERKVGSQRLMEVVGSPDMVVEIVSDSSIRKDKWKLFTAYYAAGVREYWLIDARGDEIDFQLLTRGKTGFERVLPDADGYVTSHVFGRDFRLSRELDVVGLYRYRLETRASASTD